MFNAEAFAADVRQRLGELERAVRMSVREGDQRAPTVLFGKAAEIANTLAYLDRATGYVQPAIRELMREAQRVSVMALEAT